MQYSNQSYLKIPKQTQTTLSFCDPTAKQLNAWVESLPMANVGETSRQLYHAIIELNQLQTSDANRIDLLELLRLPINFICQQLNNRFLNQGVVLNEQQRKIANLAQALQTHLAIGYKIVIRHSIDQGNVKLGKGGPFTKSIHRALQELTPAILRSYQLYIQTPVGIWQEIHQLYQVASAYNIQHESVHDPVENRDISVQHVYLKIILLGACQPNQLLQRELSDVYQSLNDWAAYLEITDIADDKSVLVINPEIDTAPQYRYLIKKENITDYLGVNVLPLVRVLHHDFKVLSTPNNQLKPNMVKENFSLGLLEHLIQSWGGMKQRSFSRTPAIGHVSIAVGLTATHYQIAGKRDFTSMLYGSSVHSDNPFIGAASNRFSAEETQSNKAKQDIWRGSLDAHDHPHMSGVDFSNTETIKTEVYPSESGILVNVSPRGYCIQWTGSPSASLKTGEVVSVKEDDLHNWNLGVVRWIRQGKEFGTQMGIELLAPNSKPCGIRQLHKTGSHGDFLRALYIPEIKAIGQDASVLTSRLPFDTGNKVSINLDGQEEKYQLAKRILSTGVISQFQIRPFTQKNLESEQKSKSEESNDFESLWRQL